MDLISELPEALLLNILSLLPAQDVASTMFLSKRWRFLWTSVPRLEYDDSYQGTEYRKFSRFVDRFLFLHESPVIETLHFKLGKTCGGEDIRVWIRAADKCCVRELIFEIDASSNDSPPIVLPSSLYTRCIMLVTLKLNKVILEDTSSSIAFPSLKTLSLVSVEYPGDEFVSSLLSSCHVLEDLHVEQCSSDNVTIFNVRVPSLKSLVLHALADDDDDDDEYGFVIDTPSLEWLDIVDYREGFCIIENGMPKIMTASFDVNYSHSGEIMRTITSVKRLDLCLSTSSKNAYPSGSVFCCLAHLKICTCQTEWLELLMCMLRYSPKLQSLRLKQYHEIEACNPRPCWTEPNSVPDCLVSSLEALEWVGYEGTEEEKEVVAFILRSAKCLERVTIYSSSKDPCKKLELVKELSFLPRCSSSCNFLFD
ncbi:probable FBD-associated F-box protein At1g32375 isoform X2 [Raphanus sativus]|uniref:Probable FBD-associated F-box protein At1g32375 isoform X2 n=1 Tax=Raphanus sativus TaxID=3726 RepID=A0A6J0MSU9_RAPSA|nr:probable FBD-associated F-box protein At1g32375 isoform X2 [Raphanus sativus]